MGRHSVRDDQTMLLPIVPDTMELPEPARESTHIVRSHRRPPSPYRGAIILAVFLAVSAVPILSMRNPAPAEAQALSVPVAAAVKPVKATTALVPTLPAFPPPKPVTKPVAKLIVVPPPTKLVGAEKVIAFAMAQLGDRYVWAASGPNSWDCSGLVMMAFKQIGITLPHFTGDIIHKGTAVSRANMIRGDVFFPTSSHVGIYLGNNKFIAANVGGVSIQEIYSFYAARRIS